MKSIIKYYEGINSVAVIGNYVPRQCGIATFTHDVASSVSSHMVSPRAWGPAICPISVVSTLCFCARLGSR